MRTTPQKAESLALRQAQSLVELFRSARLTEKLSPSFLLDLRQGALPLLKPFQFQGPPSTGLAEQILLLAQSTKRHGDAWPPVVAMADEMLAVIRHPSSDLEGTSWGSTWHNIGFGPIGLDLIDMRKQGQADDWINECIEEDSFPGLVEGSVVFGGIGR
jgi:hypothetical protein